MNSTAVDEASSSGTEHLTPANSATSGKDDTLGSKVATVALVGIGVALIEVELIPGMLLGVAAMLAPNFLPRLGRAIRPLVRSTVRASFALAERTRETVAEASEQVQDMVAEAKAENAAPATPEHVAPAKPSPKHATSRARAKA